MKPRAPTAVFGDELWAITSYFNPASYWRRLANFKTFREHLSIPLVAVELAYGPDFELQEADAEILIQLRGGALLWQKERLLNVALHALPATCRKVAWLDCDVIFEKPGWCEAASSLLDSAPIIQLFRAAHYPPPHWTPDTAQMVAPELTRPSAAYSLASGTPPATCFGFQEYDRRRTSATGLAWAARREVLDQHGFFDTCIVGGGDNAFVCAANNCFDGLIQRHMMNERERERYLAWGKPYCKTVGATTEFLDAEVFHLWHGNLSDRGSRTRHSGLRCFAFDPFEDIAMDESGLWRWNSDKPAMHEYVREYFVSRREDG